LYYTNIDKFQATVKTCFLVAFILNAVCLLPLILFQFTSVKNVYLITNSVHLNFVRYNIGFQSKPCL